jgi:hypothetical protein
MRRAGATAEQLAAPPFAQVRQARARRPLVLLTPDTTALALTSPRALRGTGPVGRGGPGFWHHNRPAATPDGHLLGLAFPQVVLRPPAPKRAAPAQRRQRPREARLGAAGFGAGGPAPGIDRGRWHRPGRRHL